MDKAILTFSPILKKLYITVKYVAKKQGIFKYNLKNPDVYMHVYAMNCKFFSWNIIRNHLMDQRWSHNSDHSAYIYTYIHTYSSILKTLKERTKESV